MAKIFKRLFGMNNAENIDKELVQMSMTQRS